MTLTGWANSAGLGLQPLPRPARRYLYHSALFWGARPGQDGDSFPGQAVSDAPPHTHPRSMAMVGRMACGWFCTGTGAWRAGWDVHQTPLRVFSFRLPTPRLRQRDAHRHSPTESFWPTNLIQSLPLRLTRRMAFRSMFWAACTLSVLVLTSSPAWEGRRFLPRSQAPSDSVCPSRRLFGVGAPLDGGQAEAQDSSIVFPLPSSLPANSVTQAKEAHRESHLATACAVGLRGPTDRLR